MSKLCVITGVGEGNVVAMTRRFAAEGYRVAMLARTKSKLDEVEKSIEGARDYACDVADSYAVTDAIEQIPRGPGSHRCIDPQRRQRRHRPDLEAVKELCLCKQM